ncbi:MAG: hypothetical protein ICV64_12575 [Thermoleophilia bacterium]|nr:hypothetical protein [Thermoleophilia bacterium]
MRAPSQRPALGALFLVLAAVFAGIAVAAADAARDDAALWVVVAAGAALAVWLVGFALRAFRRR